MKCSPSPHMPFSALNWISPIKAINQCNIQGLCKKTTIQSSLARGSLYYSAPLNVKTAVSLDYEMFLGIFIKASILLLRLRKHKDLRLLYGHGKVEGYFDCCSTSILPCGGISHEQHATISRITNTVTVFRRLRPRQHMVMQYDLRKTNAWTEVTMEMSSNIWTLLLFITCIKNFIQLRWPFCQISERLYYKWHLIDREFFFSSQHMES